MSMKYQRVLFPVVLFTVLTSTALAFVSTRMRSGVPVPTERASNGRDDAIAAPPLEVNSVLASARDTWTPAVEQNVVAQETDSEPAPASGATKASGLGDAASNITLAQIARQTSYPGFTLTLSRTISPAGGQARLLSTLQRYQRSDGVYRLAQTTYQPDGKAGRVDVAFGFIGLGVFRLDEARKRLVFTGPLVDEAPENVEGFLRNNPLFAREESVEGVNTVVWRKAGPTQGEFTEEYRAPSLGGLLIKTVKVSARQNETIAPTKIESGEPAQNLFTELLLYPVDYSDYERRAQEMDKKGEREVARLMRELLRRMRSVKSDGR